MKIVPVTFDNQVSPLFLSRNLSVVERGDDKVDAPIQIRQLDLRAKKEPVAASFALEQSVIMLLVFRDQYLLVLGETKPRLHQQGGKKQFLDFGISDRLCLHPIELTETRLEQLFSESIEPDFPLSLASLTRVRWWDNFFQPNAGNMMRVGRTPASDAGR